MLVESFVVLLAILFWMDVVLCSVFFLLDNFEYLANLIGCVHAHSLLFDKFVVKFAQIFKSFGKKMGAEKLTIFTFTKNWQFLISKLTLDDSRLLILEDGKSIHIEITTLQTVDTFSYFLTRHIFSFPFVLQKLVEDWLELIDQFNTIKENLELVDSHNWNRCNFFILWRVFASIFIVSAVVHFEEIGEKLCHLLTHKEMTENVDLEMGPNLIERGYELMWILANFFERQ